MPIFENKRETIEEIRLSAVNFKALQDAQLWSVALRALVELEMREVPPWEAPDACGLITGPVIDQLFKASAQWARGERGMYRKIQPKR